MRSVLPYLIRRGILRGGIAVFAPPSGGGTTPVRPLSHPRASLRSDSSVPVGLIELGYPPAPAMQLPPNSLTDAASFHWVLEIATVVNNVLQGKMNVTLEVTLTVNAGSTTVIDARISAFSAITFMPLTVSAASEYAAGAIFVSQQKSGECVITHPNNATSDRTFRLSILA